MCVDNPIDDADVGCTLADILTFEQLHGFTFPNEIRVHYQQYNGGSPRKPVFEKEGVEYILNCFDGIPRHRVKDSALLETIADLSDTIPQGYIPFANDLFGNYFCVCVSTDHYGAIYFYDHEYEDESESLTYLAESFGAFMRSLAAIEDGDEE